MRNRTKALLTLALIGAMTVPLAAAARRPAPGAGLGSGALLERAALRLDLTAEQKGEIRAIFANHKNELEGELLAIKSTRGAMWDAIHADDPNDSAIRAAATAVGKAEGELGVTRAAMVQEVRAVLTAEQQAELKKMASDFRSLVRSFLEHLEEHVDTVLAG